MRPLLVRAAHSAATPAPFVLSALLVLGSACGSDGDANRQDFGPIGTVDSGITGVDAGSTSLPEASVVMDSSVTPRADTGLVVAVDAGTSDTGPLVSGDTGVLGDAGSDAGPVGIGLQGTGLSVFPTTGMPLETPDGMWKYHEFSETSCREGTKAGVTVFKNGASKKLMFFFQGGGACFDLPSCLANPGAVAAGDKAGPSGGILDRRNPANPVKDWNFVFVPYCSGDVFCGTNPNANIELVGPQKFVGFLNTQAFLQRIAPTFPDVTDLLVTGVSAGGFGASTSVVLIQRAFPNVKVKLLNDSGPPMPSSVLSTCLQKTWRETWGYDNSILKDCGAGCPKKDDFTFDYGLWLAKTFGNRLSGLIESNHDGIISLFFGAGSNNCASPFGLAPAIPPNDFEKGLLEFREAVKAYPTFGSYIPSSDQHTWLQGASFYSATYGGTKMVDWVSDIINDKGTKHVGP